MHDDQPTPARARRAGILVISVWFDELGPGEFLALVRTEQDEALPSEPMASEAELLAFVRDWLERLRTQASNNPVTGA